jgi:magnesium chelatase accessory protein
LAIPAAPSIFPVNVTDFVHESGQSPEWNALPTDWPDRAVSEFHHCEGLTWHVQRQGSGPTLLLVHGTGGGTHSWAGVTPLLAAHFHLVSVDLPGHAFTQVPPAVERARNPYALAGMARVLGHLLESLGERPQIAMGHSAGVSVLLQMTLDGLIAPDRLVGLCPALVAPPAWYTTLFAPVIGAVVELDAIANSGAHLAAATAIVERMLASTGTRLTDAQLARYRLLCSKPSHIHAALTMMARWDLPALYRQLHALRVPLHLVAASRDHWIPLRALTRAVQGIPGMTMQVEEGGHLLPEEKPERIAEAVLALGVAG